MPTTNDSSVVSAPAVTTLSAPPSPALASSVLASSAPAVPDQASALAVVVVSSGDLDQLDRCLDALLRQDLQGPYDILVVEDDPDPATARMVAAWRLRQAATSSTAPGGGRLRYLPNHGPTHGAGAIRNLGWRAADAQVIAFTVDDTVAAVDWLRQAMAAFTASLVDHAPTGAVSAPAQPNAAEAADAVADAIAGRVDCRLPKHPTEAQRQCFERENGAFVGCNWFCRRSLLERLGGFDERFGDPLTTDTDLYFRLLEAGARVLSVPAATVAHPLLASSWWTSLTQLSALRSDALLFKKHPHLYRDHIGRPPYWHDLVVVFALLLAAGALWRGHELLAVAAGGSWLVLTAMLAIRRLRGTAKTVSHVITVLLTSPMLPPLALFWRLAGAVRHRVRYAEP